jgi:hypothetical protein
MFRDCNAMLKRGKPDAIAPFWAEEYFFVNPRGERLAKAERLSNIAKGRTAFDTVEPRVQDEQIRFYGDVVVYSTLRRLAGQYSGRSHAGDYRALVVLVRRDGRWQQVASQLTPITDEKQ